MSLTDALRTVHAGEAVARSRIPQLPWAQLRRTIDEAVATGHRVAALFGDASADAVDVYAVLAQPQRSVLRIGASRLEGDCFESITPECPQAHLFEREIAEQFGLSPQGHPWMKRVRFHRAYRPGREAWPETRPGEHPTVGQIDYYRIEGEEVHEVAVGPVHAGVIEPGHFRFQCHGERVFHLEISLGYQHRGVEQALRGGPHRATIHTVETLAGDTSVGHATAYSQAIEGLAECAVPLRADVLRGVALELERLANHTGDLGALAGDVGFLPTASYCGRLRGDFLNLTAVLCGSRFGRGAIRPGGMGFDLEPRSVDDFLKRLDAAYRDVANAVELLWESSSVQARFEGVGTLSAETCRQLGVVGLPARAAGLECDARQDFPTGIYRFAQAPVSTWTTGDVFARAYVRWMEIRRSVAFIREQLAACPEGPVRAQVGPLRPDCLIATLVEGWRGEICHVALSDAQGRLARYKVVDPSFHNWTGLAMALRGQAISDFPLCNKSFNLSYCGHDL